MLKSVLTAGALAVLLPGAALAQVADVRFGVMAHNIKVTDGKNANKEDGPNVCLELTFASPEFLAWIGAPKPSIVASINTAGATSFGGVALGWDFEFSPGWRFEPSIGYVLHDGEVDNPFPSNDPRAVAFSNDNVLLGSEDLFRTGLALTRDLNDTWAVQLQFEHYSHGQILDKGRNQGMDNIGVRFIRRF
jgi:lipid A 3-O-deacylase